jgi:hypothetical protein
MYTAMLSVENILGANHDVWDVNVEQEYHEEGDEEGEGTSESGTGRAAPIVPRSASDAAAEQRHVAGGT